MRQTVKEKLNDKSRKMIDLIYDEVCEEGEKTLTASFIDKRTNLKYDLEVSLKVSYPKKEDDGFEEYEPSTADPETPIGSTESGDSTDSENIPDPSTNTPNDSGTDSEGLGDSNDL